MEEFYYCKTCKKQLPIDAESCEYCGDEDPFFFKKARKLRKKRDWFIGSTGMVGIGVFSYFWITGSIPGIPTWLEDWVPLIGLSVYCLYAYCIIVPTCLYFAGKLTEMMEDVYKEGGHEDLFDKWIKEIIDIY